jgi:hypothetical protein
MTREILFFPESVGRGKAAARIEGFAAVRFGRINGNCAVGKFSCCSQPAMASGEREKRAPLREKEREENPSWQQLSRLLRCIQPRTAYLHSKKPNSQFAPAGYAPLIQLLY